jgi:hypothetical protein
MAVLPILLIALLAIALAGITMTMWMWPDGVPRFHTARVAVHVRRSRRARRRTSINPTAVPGTYVMRSPEQTCGTT